MALIHLDQASFFLKKTDLVPDSEPSFLLLLSDYSTFPSGFHYCSLEALFVLLVPVPTKAFLFMFFDVSSLGDGDSCVLICEPNLPMNLQTCRISSLKSLFVLQGSLCSQEKGRL